MKNNAQEQQITLVDQKGNEELYNVLFTFESDDYNRSYILIYPADKADDEEVDIQAYALPKDEDPANPSGGDLMTITDDDEWEMIESVLNTFLDPDQSLNPDDSDDKNNK